MEKLYIYHGALIESRATGISTTRIAVDNTGQANGEHFIREVDSHGKIVPAQGSEIPVFNKRTGGVEVNGKHLNPGRQVTLEIGPHSVTITSNRESEVTVDSPLGPVSANVLDQNLKYKRDGGQARRTTQKRWR